MSSSQLSVLRRELLQIDAAMDQIDGAFEPFLSALPTAQVPSAVNLLHYLVLRRHDLRQIQPLLAAHGLSSLGRMESHVRSGLDAVIHAVHVLDGRERTPPPGTTRLTLSEGEALLAQHTTELFGPPRESRSVRVMVTMPTEAASDYTLVRDLVVAGMDCMRVNCAHDGPAEWSRMIAHLRRASAEHGRSCIVLMDIAGPKLRTGAVEPGPAVQRIKPERDAFGRTHSPAVVAIAQAGRAPGNVSADAVVLVHRAIPADVGADSAIAFIDARGRRRTLRGFARQDDVVLAGLDRTAYIVPGTVLRVSTTGGHDDLQVVDVPACDQALVLEVGESLVLTRDDKPGRPAVRDKSGRVLVPAQISVTLPEIFDDIQPGHSVWFDDGRIGGFIRTAAPDHAVVEITHARPGGDKLGSGKGINLPDTNLGVGALTDKDLEDLAFIVEHADLVGYSFVRQAEDVRRLQAQLAALGGQHLGIILKIETRRAFEELPRLLLTCMRTGRFGVMIARGDLAIECGYERMAEVQEEIMWIAEAAHAPVIWATQVLETLAKTGVPSRAEVSDAAMAERTECVMLNKGPHIREAVRMLCDILQRMEAHQAKKRARLRPLHIVDGVLNDVLTHAVV
jgi:pyruvate kinase